MRIFILDETLSDIFIINRSKSFIWTERYLSHGDFELLVPVTLENLEFLLIDYYVQIIDTDLGMIIEDMEITSNAENENMLKLSGRSLESLLERRIIWNQTILTGSLQNGIERILNENIINPTDPNRKIDNFIFQASTDPDVTNLTVDMQVDGATVAGAIGGLCETNNLGYKIEINKNKQFVFSLYAGKDRSYDQVTNPYVIFSPTFNNLLDTRYLKSTKLLKTVARVAGEGQGAERKKTTVELDGVWTGLNRREIFVDARHISSYTDDGELGNTEYFKLLNQRGLEALAEYSTTEVFEGSVDPSRTFTYGKDFFLGDIVQIENEYGMVTRSRVTELIRSVNETGTMVYPTFSKIEEEEE